MIISSPILSEGGSGTGGGGVGARLPDTDQDLEMVI